MSGYLLDTNILIALANDAVGKLPLRIREALAGGSQRQCISVVSPWEVSIKWLTGRLELNVKPGELEVLISRLGLELLPMTLDHALEVAQPEPSTKDPFDRLLLAICVCEGLKLLTTDTHLQGHRLVY